MKGGRNLPTKFAFTTHRVPQRHDVARSPTRSADEALLDLVLGRKPPESPTESHDEVDGTDEK